MRLMQFGISGPGTDALQEQVRLARTDHDMSHGLGEALQTESTGTSSSRRYQCLKCGHAEHDRREMRVSQSFWEGFFNLASGRYVALICRRCQFTEFYYGEADLAQQAAGGLPGSGER